MDPPFTWRTSWLAALLINRTMSEISGLFSPRGRIGRIRYLAWHLGLILAGGLTVFAWTALLAGKGEMAGTVYIVGYALLVSTVVILSIIWNIKRVHDFNMTGWLAVIIILPVVPLVFCLIPGTEGANNYGVAPPANSIGNYLIIALGLVVLGGMAALLLSL